MKERFQYRLSKIEKLTIAQNLIDILQDSAEIMNITRTFIYNWVLTGPDEKRKAFFDVWDIVLKNYIPTTRPILFRACNRVGKNGKISSFTGRLECANRFSKGRGYLMICDTKESLQFEELLYKQGEFKNSFYPLGKILEESKAIGGCGFTEHFLNENIGEDEYIMKIDLENVYTFKWI